MVILCSLHVHLCQYKLLINYLFVVFSAQERHDKLLINYVYATLMSRSSRLSWAENGAKRGIHAESSRVNMSANTHLLREAWARKGTCETPPPPTLYYSSHMPWWSRAVCSTGISNKVLRLWHDIVFCETLTCRVAWRKTEWSTNANPRNEEQQSVERMPYLSSAAVRVSGWVYWRKHSIRSSTGLPFDVLKDLSTWMERK